MNFEFRDAEIGKRPCYAPNLADSGGATQGARNGRVGDCGGLGGELNLDYEMGSFRAAFLVAGG